MRRLPALVPLALVACIDQTIGKLPGDDREVLDGSLRGRVCDPSGRAWLPDAMAYVNVLDDDGRIAETRVAYTDLDGYWEIDDLPGDRFYTWYVQYGPTQIDTDEVWIASGDDVVLEEPDCFDPLALDIAVVTGDYDDFHLVLNEMGFANYDVVDGQDQPTIETFLNDLAAMEQYDIIFFNGGFIEDDVLYGDAGAAERVANLRAFVADGGSIYASDWAYDVVEIGWPEYVEFAGDDDVPDDAQMGNPDPSCNASVSDTALAEFLGASTIDIAYDLPVWAPIISAQPSVTAHLVGGDLTYSDGLGSVPLNGVPLLVSFNAGQGKVVYSTFRVADNASAEMVDTLQYMMYSL